MLRGGSLIDRNRVQLEVVAVAASTTASCVSKRQRLLPLLTRVLGRSDRMAVIVKRGVEGKICSTCDAWKPLSDFPAHRTHGPSQGGRHCRCLECHRVAARKKRLREKALVARAKELGLR